MTSSQVMQVVKSISDHEIFHHYPELKKHYLCDEKLWTQSYFLETIGNVNEEVIRDYAQEQLSKQEKTDAGVRPLGLF